MKNGQQSNFSVLGQLHNNITFFYISVCISFASKASDLFFPLLYEVK